jgi:hypothetical protein
MFFITEHKCPLCGCFTIYTGDKLICSYIFCKLFKEGISVQYGEV